MEPIKALSLLQPWATLVVLGIKKIETRSWTTAYRGPLLIHAGQRKSGREAAGRPTIRQHIPSFDALPFGAIVGQVTLIDVIRLGSAALPDDELAALTLEEGSFGNDRAGRWGFLFEDAQLLDVPLPAAGKLGIWEY
jgi:hypothetical protein